MRFEADLTFCSRGLTSAGRCETQQMSPLSGCSVRHKRPKKPTRVVMRRQMTNVPGPRYLVKRYQHPQTGALRLRTVIIVKNV